MTTRSLPYTIPLAAAPVGLPSLEDVLGRHGGENFRVASRVLPARARRHLLGFYGYARLVDQIGDAYTGDRLGALDWIEAQVDGRSAPEHPLVIAALDSVNELRASRQPLLDLIAANRLDQTVGEYQTFDDLLGYCALSANPVGRLVLAAFGFADEPRSALSDQVCTGLQLVEHWQDVREDALAGRIYVPREDLDRFGVARSELAGDSPAPPRLKALMAFEAARARKFFDRGADLPGLVGGRARWAVAGFIAGGLSALDGLARRDFDVLTPPSRPRVDRVARHIRRAVRPGTRLSATPTTARRP